MNFFKYIKIMVVVGCIFLGVVGCGLLSIDENIEKYTVSVDENIIVSNGSEDYVVTDDEISDEQRGVIIGFVKDIKYGFISVFSVKEPYERERAVTVNGKTYRAVPVGDWSDDYTALVLDDTVRILYSNGKEDIEAISEDNLDEVNINGISYQITEKEVSDDEIGNMITYVGKSYVINTETGKIIDNNELKKVYMEHVNEMPRREVRIYGGIYSINGSNDAIAVQLNQKYELAVKK